MKPIRVRRALFAMAIATSAGAALACGPSFQAIYEGNVRFEHCYALEESAQTLVPEKVDCWRDWSEHYTYGQTRDRIHYATARYVALSQAANVPTDEAMMMAAPGMTPRQSSITAPAPTNAFAPPPKVLDEYPDASRRPLRPSEVPIVVGPPSASVDGGRGLPEAAPETIALPAGDCSDRCGQTFRECKDGCATGDGGAAPKVAPESACAVCEKTYRGCMRGCFK